MWTFLILKPGYYNNQTGEIFGRALLFSRNRYTHVRQERCCRALSIEAEIVNFTGIPWFLSGITLD